MKEGGAKVFAMNDGRLALIGIGKVFPDRGEPEVMLREIRKGEILARSAVLALGGDVEISTHQCLSESSFSSKGGKRISLSSFLQVTQAQVAGEIQQLPVVGSWWGLGSNGTENRVKQQRSDFSSELPQSVHDLSASGKLVFGVFAAFAEFERELIRK